MKLHLYIARRFLKSFLLVLGVLAMVFVLLDLVEQTGRFGSSNVGFIDLLQLTFLRTPAWMYRILPLTVILATLILFLGLSRSSEMVVTRAAGRSALITLLAPMTTVFLIGLLALTVFNPISAATTKQYTILIAQYGGSTSSTLSLSPEGLWLRQGDDDGQTVIHAARAGMDGTQLFDVTFFSFDPDGLPRNRVEASSALLQKGRWALQDAKVWSLALDANPEQDAVRHQVFWIKSNLTREQIQDGFGRPAAISIWDLPGFVTQLEEAGFSSRAHRVWLQMELATPLFLVAMVLIGAGFTMRHTRFGHTGMMVLFALMFGFGIFFIRNFAQILGENGQIPVLVAAWTAPVAAILASLGVLLHLEDG